MKENQDKKRKEYYLNEDMKNIRSDFILKNQHRKNLFRS